MKKDKISDKVKMQSYPKHSSPPAYHYLRVTVLTREENYFDNERNLPDNIDFRGKNKIDFGWHFGWSCEQDYSDVPKKMLQKAVRLAKRLEKDNKVLKCTIYNAMI